MIALPTHILPDLRYAELIYVEGGSFRMGRGHLTLPSFAIGKYPVTQELYEAVMLINPSRFKDQHRPVEMVSWYDAQSFLQKLNQKCAINLPIGCRFRLPSEAEWDYAARGGKFSKGYIYAGGNDMDKIGWCRSNSHDETKVVGLKLPNELDLYDMSGNVWEWCEDDWHPSIQSSPNNGSAYVDLQGGTDRVFRGGSWYDNARYYRTSRSHFHPTRSSDSAGFRVAFFFPSGSWATSRK